MRGRHREPTITHLGHGQLTLEPTPHTVVNTLRLPPCLLHALVAVGLVAPTDWNEHDSGVCKIAVLLEGLGALLNDGNLDHGGLECTSRVSNRARPEDAR